MSARKGQPLLDVLEIVLLKLDDHVSDASLVGLVSQEQANEKVERGHDLVADLQEVGLFLVLEPTEGLHQNFETLAFEVFRQV